MLPFAVRFAVLIDLLLNAVAAVAGPEHVLLAPAPMTQFGILVAVGIGVHEVTATGSRAITSLLRWWRRWRK